MAMKFSKEFFSVFNLLSLFRNKKGQSSVLDLSDWENGLALIRNCKVCLLTFKNCVIDIFCVCLLTISLQHLSKIPEDKNLRYYLLYPRAWNHSWYFAGSKKNMCWLIESGVQNKLISLTWVECPRIRWNLCPELKSYLLRGQWSSS